jgi:hypothetical protein
MHDKSGKRPANRTIRDICKSLGFRSDNQESRYYHLNLSRRARTFRLGFIARQKITAPFDDAIALKCAVEFCDLNAELLFPKSDWSIRNGQPSWPDNKAL